MRIFYAAVGTGIIVFIYTIFTLLIWIANINGNSVNQENLIYANRAEVGMKEFYFLDLPSGYGLIPVWENTGNTETQYMESHINWHISRDELPPGFSNVDQTGPSDVAQISLPAKTENRILFGVFPKACIDEMTGGSKFRYAYIWGWARYNDIFTEKKHVTKFCWKIVGLIKSQSESEKVRLIYDLCSEGNCTDKECTPDDRKPNLPVDLCVPMALNLGHASQ
jgi:hypothetical protein